MTENAALLYAWLVSKNDSGELNGMPLAVVHDATGLTDFQIIEAWQELVRGGHASASGPSGTVPVVHAVEVVE